MPKEKRFIAKFVNSIYGILLGFGFCNVVQEILTNQQDVILLASHIVMTAFIIVVVCLYWWDWSENIETEVQSTFSEFTIDILILFTLEFLFFQYDNPKGLAILFLTISILNLIWVLNFLWEKKRNGHASADYLKNKRDSAYLRKKLYGVLVSGICLLSIVSIELYLNLEGLLLHTISNILIIVFFMINRIVAFTGRPI